MESKTLAIENVATVEMFTRSNPTCHFCNQTRAWVKERLGHADVVEYNINTDSDKWAEFLQKHPCAKSVPQITLTMKNRSRRHIGGYSELVRAFSVSEQEEVQ